MEKVQTAAHCVTRAAEHGGPMIFAQKGMMQAIHRHHKREFNPDRKDHHWIVFLVIRCGPSRCSAGDAPEGRQKLCSSARIDFSTRSDPKQTLAKCKPELAL